ncbi:MAG TPA: MBL fold metallo-hydrolase [Polyangiaceae bacterium]|nr:MBL fold metallo-hydrolase [Polyangiaceae bacterium]
MASQYRFVNLDGSTPQKLSRVLKWAVVDRVLGRRRPDRRPANTPRVAPDLDVLRQPPLTGQGVRLTWVGHASWLVQLDGVSLLIDPIFSESIGPGVQRHIPAAITVAGLPHIDAQLVTHNHRDHLDLPSLKAVGRPIIAGLGLSEFFAREKLECTELDWWATTRIGDVSVHFVPSQHWSRRGLSDENQTLWGGFVVEGSSARIYHSGDTAYFEGFAQIAERAGPIDAALLPIGAYEPEWFMRQQHMNPEDAARAFTDLGAREFIAMHWGTFQLTDEPMAEPPQRLEREWQRRGLDPARCHVLPIGGSMLVRSLGVDATRRAGG